ncbi:PucR family transcriptional regulator [Mycobacterium sp. CBMA293]|uniref:PucR family transcriptional regulator n=1 Tax=unclassified Mycolicibacterium TaxID=2636767 RepID=UPI0012DBF560|nr:MULTISPECIES: helix-turn-helix domain-containing protein [unclassified Mycolicibacterium]MUL48313.1 PucR family transcriptional regulator [Mycolicibacterium sp. CBMA 360]MUL57520.1 PucR family transcriptional regulator [Mycolicibacterium sp. CBMA 335]MUL70560.1 PucR family transcriptional regulator [Mycolicibacterium sp. CBMA 311]MUL92608.1 PucR family transcriptional regulator [Mycolicibacterium sp. CBMA 230]MUM04985.1 PucR family transcriptional regulator [Mycolicibacterium sp. CBMA 213]
MAAETPSPEVVNLMGDVAELLLSELDELVAEMDAAAVELSPAAGSDAAVLADTSASNRANVARLLSIFARREAKVLPIDIPPEALDIARTVARRGLDLDVIFQSYRRGQNVAWRRYMAHATRLVPSGPLLFELLEVASQRMFEFVDHVVGKVIAAAQQEREEILGGAIARRSETIRLILDGAAIDQARASERLGYDLRQRHTALVLWTPPHGDVQGALESAAAVLARAAGTRPPLTLSVGPSTLWAWLGSNTEPMLDALASAIEQAQNNIRAAVGPTRPDISGFRRSHEAALSIQSMLAGHAGGARVALFRDLEVTALAAQNTDRAAEFVAATLGPLAEDGSAAARLRETLRVFLDEAENAPRTAVRLHTHRNTVLQRVARATELLGYQPGERRLAMELALELAHQLGPRVLTAALV